MKHREYSAGAVKLSFWFLEFSKVVQLLAAGNSFDEIRQKNQEENIFGAPTQRRADQICRTVLTRVQALDSSFYPVFLSGDLATQKLFVLVVFDLYDLIIDHLETRNFLKQCMTFEQKQGFSRITKAVNNSMKISGSDSLIVRHIWEHTPENAVVFLTGIGKCYPILLHRHG